MKITGKSSRRQRIRFNIRRKIGGTTAKPRLSVFRSNTDIYAQIIDDVKGNTLASASTKDKDIVAQLGKLKVGGYSQPQAFMDERVGKKGVRILYLKSRSEPHKMNLRDDYNKIASAALEEKKYLTLEKWLIGNIPTHYIMVDPTIAGCKQLNKWITDKTAKTF